MPPFVPRPDSLDAAHEQLIELANDLHSLRNAVTGAKGYAELAYRKLKTVPEDARTPDTKVAFQYIAKAFSKLGGRVDDEDVRPSDAAIKTPPIAG